MPLHVYACQVPAHDGGDMNLSLLEYCEQHEMVALVNFLKDLS